MLNSSYFDRALIDNSEFDLFTELLKNVKTRVFSVLFLIPGLDGFVDGYGEKHGIFRYLYEYWLLYRLKSKKTRKNTKNSDFRHFQKIVCTG